MAWADEIKALDDFRCAYCGSTKNLNACHIKSRREHPELEKCLENGITLCRKCHYASHHGFYSPGSGYSYQEFAVSPNVIKQFIADYVATRIILSVPKGGKDTIQAHAQAHSESVNGFINRAISETMERDNAAPGAVSGPTEVEGQINPPD